MKAGKANIARSLDQPDPKTRFYLFHGPDEAQSRALSNRLAESLGATKIRVSASRLKSDPAELVDQASAISLFGGSSVIWIESASDDVLEAVTALLEAPAVESPAVAIAGALRKTSTLLRLAEASPLALAYVSYVPEGVDAERMVIDAGRRAGLKIAPDLAARIAAAAGNDQAIVTQELEKFAIFGDASPQSPKELEMETIDAIGADSADGNFMRLADLALGGEAGELTEELAKLSSAGTEAIPVVRSLQRRVLMLAPARARVERGERPDAVMTSLGKSLFWKDKPLVERMIRKWTADDLAKILERAARLERTLFFSSAPVREALGEELLTIARKARTH